MMDKRDWFLITIVCSILAIWFVPGADVFFRILLTGLLK